MFIESNLMVRLRELASSREEARNGAIAALAAAGSDAIEPLKTALRVGSVPVCLAAVQALGEIADEPAITVLIETMRAGEAPVREQALRAVVEIGAPAVEPLIRALQSDPYDTVIHILRDYQNNTVVETLIAELATHLRSERGLLMQALGDIGDARALECLAQALYDVDASIRETARAALGKLGTAAVAPLLRSQPNDADEERSMAEALAQVGTPALDMLETALIIGNETTRRVAVRALGQFPDSRVIVPLTLALQDSEEWVRMTAVIGLAEFGADALDPLLNSLKDRSPLVRGEAARALGHIRDVRATIALLQMIEYAEPPVRDIALQALGEFENVQDAATLIYALRTTEPSLRRSAANALLRMGTAAVEPLIAALPQDIFGDAARILGRLGVPEAVEPLIMALQIDNDALRQGAVEALGLLNDNRSALALAQALSDLNPSVRQAAIAALNRMQDPRAVEWLVGALRDSSDKVRETAAEVLVEIGPLAVTPLIGILDDPNWRVRQQAVRVLGRIGGATVVEPLLRQLHDTTGSVRSAVMEELKKLCDIRAVGPLLRTLEDSDSYSRESAAKLLARIGDLNAMPLRVLTEKRLTERERIEALTLMRRARYRDEHIIVRFPIPDVYEFCQEMIVRGDAEARQEAQALLTYFTLMRPGIGSSTTDRAELLRSTQNAQGDDRPEVMLRAIEEAGDKAVVETKHSSLRDRLFKSE